MRITKKLVVLGFAAAVTFSGISHARVGGVTSQQALELLTVIKGVPSESAALSAIQEKFGNEAGAMLWKAGGQEVFRSLSGSKVRVTITAQQVAALKSQYENVDGSVLFTAVRKIADAGGKTSLSKDVLTSMVSEVQANGTKADLNNALVKISAQQAEMAFLNVQGLSPAMKAKLTAATDAPSVARRLALGKFWHLATTVTPGTCSMADKDKCAAAAKAIPGLVAKFRNGDLLDSEKSRNFIAEILMSALGYPQPLAVHEGTVVILGNEKGEFPNKHVEQCFLVGA